MSNSNNKELLFSLTKNDFRIDYFRASGPGGQHRNKTDSACRITHIESGAVGEATESRSQHDNRKAALERLVASTRFQMWHKQKVAEILAKKTIEEQVDEMMDPKYVRVETRVNGKWEVVNDEKV